MDFIHFRRNTLTVLFVSLMMCVYTSAARAEDSVGVVNNNVATDAQNAAVKPASPPQSPLAGPALTQTAPRVDTGSVVINMVVGLTGVVLLILAISWGMKRFSHLPGQSGGQLKISATLAVGTRERISLIDVGKKRILVGITAHAISVLHVFEEDELPVPAASSDFARKLQSMLSKGGADAK